MIFSCAIACQSLSKSVISERIFLFKSSMDRK